MEENEVILNEELANLVAYHRGQISREEYRMRQQEYEKKQEDLLRACGMLAE